MTKTKNESNAESVTATPSFIQEIFKDAIKKQVHAQKQVQEYMERNKPMFDRIAEIAKQTADMHALATEVITDQGMNVIKREIAEAVDDEVSPLTTQTIHLSQEDRSHIVEALAEKMAERHHALLAKGGTKNSALFSVPIVPLPKNSRWEDITLAFKNTHDIEVRYGDTHIGIFDYEELEFARMNTKDKIADGKWELLQKIAIMSAYSKQTATYPTKRALMTALYIKIENTVEKRRSELATQLRKTFGINDDPFLPYHTKEGYRPKFVLLPESTLRGNGELHRSGGKFKDHIYEDIDE